MTEVGSDGLSDVEGIAVDGFTGVSAGSVNAGVQNNAFDLHIPPVSRRHRDALEIGHGLSRGVGRSHRLSDTCVTLNLLERSPLRLGFGNFGPHRLRIMVAVLLDRTSHVRVAVVRNHRRYVRRARFPATALASTSTRHPGPCYGEARMAIKPCWRADLDGAGRGDRECPRCRAMRP
jgi:hypothetical protein